MPTMFAHSKHHRKENVCTQQLACRAESWHAANMNFRIRELRKLKGLTIDQMVALTGYSRGYLSQLETGKRQPSMETLTNLALALGVAVTDLYEDQDLGEHLRLMRELSEEDQAAVIRHAQSLSRKAAG